LGIELDHYEKCRNCGERTAYTIARGIRTWQYCEACGIESYQVGKDMILVGSAQAVREQRAMAMAEADRDLEADQRAMDRAGVWVVEQ
jgi:predicted  nucleic acid-binding Zn-ribbon protein